MDSISVEVDEWTARFDELFARIARRIQSGGFTTAAVSSSSIAAPATLTAMRLAAAARSNHAPTVTFGALAVLDLLGGGLCANRRSRCAKADSGDV